MNLSKLFEFQRKLDAEIEEKHPTLPGEDRLAKRILALQVELGECANEWRGFKFWSNNPFPKPPEHNWRASEDGLNQEWVPEWGYYSYPLLEEYVDCLHFTLSILLTLDEVGSCSWFKPGKVKHFIRTDLNHHFIELNGLLSEIYFKNGLDARELIYEVLALGEGLGFTWEQVTDAYMSKNKTNWERQANGY